MKKSNIGCSTRDTITSTTIGPLVLPYQENFLISSSVVIAHTVPALEQEHSSANGTVTEGVSTAFVEVVQLPLLLFASILFPPFLFSEKRNLIFTDGKLSIARMVNIPNSHSNWSDKWKYLNSCNQNKQQKVGKEMHNYASY